MARYRLLEGEHRGPGDQATVKTFKKGDIIESQYPMDKMFVGKFEEVLGAERVRHETTDESKVFSEEPHPVTPGRPQVGDQLGAPIPPKVDPPAKVDQQDVTENFDLAQKNDYKVFYTKGVGYVVMDGNKQLTDGPLRSKNLVEAFITDHLKNYKE